MIETSYDGNEDRQTVVTSNRDDAFATLALLASVMAAVIAAIYWVARIGFDNPVLPVLKALALSLVIITGPFTLRLILRLNARPYTWFRSYSFLSIMTLVVTAVLGSMVPSGGERVLYPLATLGLVGLVCVAARFAKCRSAGEGLLLLAGSAVFATWASGVVWGRNYKNPLIFENLATSGDVHHDTLFLAALGNMLRTYGVPSTGINGIPYVSYHWGSAWLFAQWSNLVDSSVLDFYQMGFAVTVIPLFFAGTLALALELSCLRQDEDAVSPLTGLWFWGVFLAVTIGVIPIAAMDALGVWTSNLTISESYAVAVPVALLLVACTVIFWRGGAEGRMASEERLSVGDNVFLVAILPIGIAMLGYLKISLMILAFGLGLYLAFRVRLYRRPVGIAAILLATLLVSFTYPRVSMRAQNEGVFPFEFMRSYVPWMWWAFFPVLHLFWSWVYAMLRLIQERTATLGDLRAQVKAGRLLDVEAVLLVALLGVAPGMIIRIGGGSAFYFSDVQRWLALALLLSTPPLWLSAFKRSERGAPATEARGLGTLRTARVAAAVFALPLVATMAMNTVFWTRKFMHANAATRMSLYPLSLTSSISPGIHGLPRLADERLLRDGLDASRNYRVLDQLRGLSSISLDERRRTLLFIPQSERLYWNILAQPRTCSFSSSVAPALANMAMIDGMPPFDCTLIPFFGGGEYTPRKSPQTAADASAQSLCRKARAVDFRHVMSLHFDSTGLMTATRVACTANAVAATGAANGPVTSKTQ